MVNRPHERFHFSDGNLKLKVENTIYLVHSYLFEIHARNFTPTLNKPLTLGNISPLHILKDVVRTDFDRLLSCLYPRELMIEEARSSEEWASILALASKWEFQSLCKRARSELESLATPIEKVILGRKYGISELCLPAYVDLCQSTVPLTEEDGERLGLQDVIKIYRVRQELWGQEVRSPISSEDLLEKVKTHFPPSVQPPPASPSHSGGEPKPLPPQSPSVRSRSPPTPHRRFSPQLLTRTDPPQRAKAGDRPISPSNKSLEADTPIRVASPPTWVEVPPATPPQIPQLARALIFTPAQKSDWVAQSSSIDMEPSAKAPKPKAKPQQPPPNPPGTGKKAKRKAALLAAMNANPPVAQPSPAPALGWWA